MFDPKGGRRIKNFKRSNIYKCVSCQDNFKSKSRENLFLGLNKILICTEFEYNFLSVIKNLMNARLTDVRHFSKLSFPKYCRLRNVHFEYLAVIYMVCCRMFEFFF